MADGKLSNYLHQAREAELAMDRVHRVMEEAGAEFVAPDMYIIGVNDFEDLDKRILAALEGKSDVG